MSELSIEIVCIIYQKLVVKASVILQSKAIQTKDINSWKKEETGF